jgi:Fic family protein
MIRGETGRYRVSQFGGETVRAFVPNPLPPVAVIDLGGARQRLLDNALVACGRLDAVTALLPDPELFLYTYVRREAVLSSQIEGTQSSLSDLLLYELVDAPGAPIGDVVEVSNYVAALEHGLQRIGGGFPLSSRLLREVHAKLLAHGRGADKQPGEFRRTQNWIGGTRPGNAHFVPPPPNDVADCMSVLEKFIHDDISLQILIKAALAHVQFETIHPFLDGNGRVGRLLISLMLHDAKILQQPLLYLSLYFKQNRPDYYRLLDSVRTNGDWEAWIEFFLHGVNQTASAAVTTAHQLNALFIADQKRLTQDQRTANSLYPIFSALKRRPICTVDALAKNADVTFPTANAALKRMVELGIARELTGRTRGRVFAYDAYIKTLNEGAEPFK